MKRNIILPTAAVIGTVDEALMDVQQSFERFCLAAGMDTLCAMGWLAAAPSIALRPPMRANLSAGA